MINKYKKLHARWMNHTEFKCSICKRDTEIVIDRETTCQPYCWQHLVDFINEEVYEKQKNKSKD